MLAVPGTEPILLTETDAVDVADLYYRCADYFILQDGVPPALSDAHELFTDLPAGKEGHEQTVFGLRGAVGLSAVAAILRDYPTDGIWYLGLLIVDRSMRGQGFGRRLYAAIEHVAKERGAKEIRLAVLEANREGKRFWRSLGFVESRRVGPDHFKQRTHYRLELQMSL